MKPRFHPTLSLLIVMLALFSGSLNSQPLRTNMSLPFLRNYTSKEYKAHGQNFDLLQDNRGVIYCANFSGVLEYDGQTWRLIPTANNAKVTSLDKDKAGRIYVGARGEFGYLAADTTGNMRFISLSRNLKGEDKKFQDVISTFAANDRVYFVTEKAIYIISGKNIKVIKCASSVISAFYVNEKLYCSQKDQGLKTLEGETLVTVRGMENMLPSIEFYAMMPLKNGQMLLGSGNQGLYYLGNGRIEKFATEADNFLIGNKLSCGAELNDNSFCFGTTRGGIINLYPDGRIKKIIDQSAGLQNEYVNNLFVDKDNSLWAALNNGITLIEVPSPLSYITEKSGLKGGVLSIKRLNDKIYFGSYRGLFYSGDKSLAFQPIKGINTACWSLLADKNSVLAASSEGVFEINGGGGGAAQLGKEFTLFLYRSKSDPGLVLAGQINGLAFYRNGGKKWTSGGKAAGFNYEVRSIAEDNSGNIWIGTTFNGIFRYSLKGNNFEHYDSTKGLPDLTGTQVNEIKNKILVTSKSGIYSFDYERNVFRPDNILQGNSGNTSGRQSRWIYKITEDEAGNLIVNDGEEINLTYFRKSGEDKYSADRVMFLPIADFITWTIYPDQNNIIWFGGPDGLVVYDLNVQKNYSADFSALIRRVSLPDGREIFSGAYYDKNFTQSLEQNSSLKPHIVYSDNTIGFEFASLNYNIKNENSYQYMLQGFDENWSDWTSAPMKEYTNLPEGKYTFKVRAKNIYGRISKDAAFDFVISGPWYRSWIAYLFYFLLFAGGVFGVVKVRSRKLEKEKKILEDLIIERTAEVVRQKEEIEEKSVELTAKNEELEKINSIVKAINSEINFSNLLQSILNRILIIKGIEKASMLVLDKASNSYKFKASYNRDETLLDSANLTLEQAEKLYIKNTDEIYEDLFYSTGVKEEVSITGFGHYTRPASMLVLLVKVDDKVEGFLILENLARKDAFSARDISFLKNLKEHIIAAFIKTKILSDLQSTLDTLQDAQTKLVQSEKLASLGQLTAGIAHEIKNPLNFINNFSSLSKDLLIELSEELDKLKDKFDDKTNQYIEEITGDLRQNLIKINDHGKRVDSIVKGMLLHSRGKAGEMQKTSINGLLDEFISLAYHGFRAQDSTFNIKLETHFDDSIEMVNVVPQNLSRVFLNIFNNACYSTNEKKKEKGSSYSPVLCVTTKNIGDKIEISIRDNGKGIPKSILDKIFNPFFTTKPAGKGTGLGLSLSYDIVVQEHKGELRIESEEGEYAEFIIIIPKNLSAVKP